jgi:hypothetical protein
MKKTKSDEKPVKGQPTKYQAEYAHLAYMFCLKGATDAELAEMLGIAESTVNLWKKKYPAFANALRNGKFIADTEVANSLYRQATGYTKKVEKAVNIGGTPDTILVEEYFPGNVQACKFWLINRDRKNWRDKQDVEHSGSIDLAAFFKKLEGTANKLPDSMDSI